MSLPALRLEALGGSIELAPEGPRPAIDRGRARISELALNRLLERLSLSLRLLDGQADLTTEVSGVRIGATVTARASATGRLHLEATGLRLLGWLPVPPHLVSLALSRLEGRRGLFVVGPRAVELDLAELLADLPVQLDVRLSSVQIRPGWLELHCVPRG
jgi:hypothetical protein